ncbi:ATP-binding cassette domain-containing protein [Candidatus Peregrinibacteria bacterium]|jgi:ABC-2 type transport system ATP-binding protein|nr:ATP-binding cassette domain-containing protein [Candidatus Peregrinibacteria bacterium]
MIQVKNLKKLYASFQALNGINFTANKGEILALLGPNGAGKTTTMKIITGFLSANSGEVEIDGKAIEESALDIQGKLGYLPENTPLYPDLNVYEHLEFSAEVHGIVDKIEKKKAIDTVVKLCSLKEKLYFDISELSKGYKQRVALAQAIIHNPEYLILDEPTTGLDPNQILEIRELIREIGKKKTVILSSHIMQEVEALADRVIVINSGEIVAEGTPAELMQGDMLEDTAMIVHLCIRGAQKDVIASLEKIKSVNKVKKEESVSRGICRYSVQVSEDNREELCAAIVKAKFGLLECMIAKQSLEDVFQELTR